MKNLIHHVVFLGAIALSACATTAPTSESSAAASLNTQSYFGYRRVVVNGEELFCHNDPYTGSRIQKEMTCYTAAQVEERAENSRNFLDNIETRSTLSGTPSPAVGAAGR